MWKQTVIELSQTEILQIGKADAINYHHESNAPTPTGIRMIFNGFYDFKRDKILEEVVRERILKHLRDQNIIDSARWRFAWVPEHHWSLPNDDGERHSVYTLRAEVFQRHHIIEEE